MPKRKQSFIEAIKTHIPPTRESAVTVCTRVDRPLYEDFKTALAKDNYTIQAFTEGAIRAYLDGRKGART